MSDEWTDALTQLNAALADLYPDIDASRRIVAAAGLQPGAIRFSDAAAVNWFNILTEARRRNRVQALVKIAVADFPEDGPLQSAATAPSPLPSPSPGSPAPMAATSLEDKQLLFNSLLSAFPSKNDWQLLLAMGLDERLAEIVDGGNLRDLVLGILNWAEAEGRTEELLEAALKERPKNRELAAAVERVRRTTGDKTG